MWSSLRGFLDAVKLLLDTNQVDLDIRNQGGYTALMLAQFNNHPQVTKLLRERGATS